uniref:Histone-lysine N-methyltransferase SUVR2 isoform X1 n=1 Tax=Rhizophora mucronata TaxID=61149 RepID=A0A2P2MMV9_RHIMU
MAPNPRILKAFRAMKALGIGEEKVKPVLKRLLKLYDKNWELIEVENYRALADAIFEEEDAKVPEENEKGDNFEEDAQVHDEPERPLKRLRLRSQDRQSSPSLNNSNAGVGGTLKTPKIEDEGVEASSFLQSSPKMRKSEPRPISPQDHCSGNVDKRSVFLVPSVVQGNSSPSVERTVSSNSLPPQLHQSYKGKEHFIPQPADREKRLILVRPSHGVCIKEPTVDSRALLPKEKVHETLGLIKPKDEPFTDDMPLNDTVQYEVPIAVIRPDYLGKEDSSVQCTPMGNLKAQEPPILNSVAEDVQGDDVPASSSEGQANCELTAIPEESPATLDIATSSLGEVKISLTCNSMIGRPNFHMPSQDELLKSMEEKCLRSYKIIDPNFSVMQMLKDMCECFLELATDSSHESQEKLLNVTPALDLLKKSAMHNVVGAGGIKVVNSMTAGITNGSTDLHYSPEVDSPQVPKLLESNALEGMQPSKEVIVNNFGEGDNGNGVGDHESTSLVVVPQFQFTSDKLRSLHSFNDITKGEEMFKISWLNEINSECLPSFHYIPQNLVFQNAYVSFTLSQIRAEDCCSSCIGDCLTSPTPCACTREIKHGFAYTPEGLVKEDFLEDCISSARDPQQQCLFYCKDCALERSKNDEMLEPCKGHLQRKYIQECWFKCGCHKLCGNRVVQRGSRCKLQVFFTPEEKGWGLRTLEKLPKGAFVCEYIGEILTTKELYERKAQRARSSNIERHTYPVLLDSYWWLKGDINEEEALCLDATFYGNVARFINHRCLDANLIEIPVKIETPAHHYYRVWILVLYWSSYFQTLLPDILESFLKKINVLHLINFYAACLLHHKRSECIGRANLGLRY